MPHHMVVPKTKKEKNNPGGSHYRGPKRRKDQPELFPTPGRDSASYRGARRNILEAREKDSKIIITRRLNNNYTSLGEYQTVYTMGHPELVKKVSNRGEVHYGYATDEAAELERQAYRDEREARAREFIRERIRAARHPELTGKVLGTGVQPNLPHRPIQGTSG